MWVIVVDDVQEDWSAVEQLLQDEVGAGRVFSCRWNIAPDLNRTLDDLVRCLAQAVFDIWPEWYGRCWISSEENSSTEISLKINQLLRELHSSRPRVIASWMQEATRLTTAGQLPLPAGVPRALQVGQLALALETQDLLIMLGTLQTVPQHARSLVAAAEWLASESKAQVAIVVAKADHRHEALQRLPHALLDLTASSKENPSTEHSVPEPMHTLSPPLGRPHPFSPAEQLLYSRLTQDSELCRLISFNQLVTLGDFTKYRVDLLWSAGKIVVEIDGMREHLNRYAFVRDRERDAELLIHGYLVLRLPHDQVMEDVDQAVDRIRRVVKLRQSGS